MRPALVKPPPPSLRFQRKDTEQYHVCIAAPGIARTDRRRFAASLLDGILGGSASSRLFQEIREKRGMAYAVYSFASQYTDTGQIGVYIGTREDNVSACLEIASEQIADIAGGNVRPDELARAKENLKGRILLSMESTSNRMSRLGKSLITDTELLSIGRIMAEIDAVEPDALAELAEVLLAPGEALGRRDRAARGAVPRSDRARESRARARRVKVALFGRGGKVGTVLAPALEACRARAGRARRRRRRWSTSPRRTRSRRTCAPRWSRACRASSARAAGIRRHSGALAAERGLPLLVVPNFALGAVLMMRLAAEAARHLPRAEIVELHGEGKKDAPSGTAKATAEALGGVPVHSVRLPGLVAHQEVLFGGEGQLLTIRHDAFSREAYVPGVLLALERLGTLPPGLTLGLDALLD